MYNRNSLWDNYSNSRIYSFLINHITVEEFTKVQKKLKDLSSTELSYEEHYQLLLCIIKKYTYGLLDQEKALGILKIIYLIIKKFPLLLDTKETINLWDLIVSQHGVLLDSRSIQLLLTTKDTISKFPETQMEELKRFGISYELLPDSQEPSAKTTLYLLKLFSEITTSNQAGNLAIFYNLQEKYKDFLNRKLKIKNSTRQNEIVRMIIHQIKTCLSNWVEGIEGNGLLSHVNMMLVLTRGLFMLLCIKKEVNQQLQLSELAETSNNIVFLSNTLIAFGTHRTELKKELNLTLNFIRDIFDSKSLSESLYRSVMEHLFSFPKQIMQQLSINDFQTRDQYSQLSYSLFEIHSYTCLLANKLNFKMDVGKVLFKEQILKLCLENKINEYFEFLINHTDDVVEKEIQKIKLTQNRYPGFYDVLIFTEDERVEVGIQQDNLTFGH